MKFQFLFAAVILSAITSCSPYIGTVITKTYPVSENNEDIEVFMDVSTAPAGSESLGVVSVTDAGLTIKCDSLTVINLLKEEARKAGGNAVLVTEYVKPSFWGSSCHQMTGSILKVHDFNSQFVTENADSSQLAVIKVIKPDPKLPQMILSANLGRGWRLAKLNSDAGIAEREYQKKLMSGLTGDVSFNYYFNDYYGAGLIYAAYNANQSAYGDMTFMYDGHTETGYRNTRNLIQFIGPVFSIRTPAKNLQWIFDCNIGIGYLGYSSKETFQSHSLNVAGSMAGTYSSLGMEYRLDGNWALGVRTSVITGVLRNWTIEEDGLKKSYSVDDLNEGIGLGQFHLLAGIRYYFNKRNK